MRRLSTIRDKQRASSPSSGQRQRGLDIATGLTGILTRFHTWVTTPTSPLSPSPPPPSSASAVHELKQATEEVVAQAAPSTSRQWLGFAAALTSVWRAVPHDASSQRGAVAEVSATYHDAVLTQLLNSRPNAEQPAVAASQSFRTVTAVLNPYRRSVAQTVTRGAPHVRHSMPPPPPRKSDMKRGVVDTKRAAPKPHRARASHQRRTTASSTSSLKSWTQAMHLYSALSTAGVSTSRSTLRQLFAAVPVWVSAIGDTVHTTAASTESHASTVASQSTVRAALLEEALGSNTVSGSLNHQIRSNGGAAAPSADGGMLQWQEALKLLCGVSSAWPWDVPSAAAASVPPPAVPEVPDSIATGHTNTKTRTAGVVLTAIGHAARFAASNGDWREALHLVTVGHPHFAPQPNDSREMAAFRREHHLRAASCVQVALAVAYCAQSDGIDAKVIDAVMCEGGDGVTVLPTLSDEEMKRTRQHLFEAPRANVTGGEVDAAAAYVMSRWCLQPIVDLSHTSSRPPQLGDVPSLGIPTPASDFGGGLQARKPPSATQSVALSDAVNRSTRGTALMQLRRCVIATGLGRAHDGAASAGGEASSHAVIGLCDVVRHRYHTSPSVAASFGPHEDEGAPTAVRAARDDLCFVEAAVVAGTDTMRTTLLKQISSSTSPSAANKLAHVAAMGLFGDPHAATTKLNPALPVTTGTRPGLLKRSPSAGGSLSNAAHLRAAADKALLLAAFLKARRRVATSTTEEEEEVHHDQRTALDLSLLAAVTTATASTLDQMPHVRPDAARLLADVALRALLETRQGEVQRQLNRDRAATVAAMTSIILNAAAAPTRHSREARRVRRLLHRAGVSVREILESAPHGSDVSRLRSLLLNVPSADVAVIDNVNANTSATAATQRTMEWRSALATFDGKVTADALPLAASAAAAGAWDVALRVIAKAYFGASTTEVPLPSTVRHVGLYSCAAASRPRLHEAVLLLEHPGEDVTLAEVDVAVRRILRPLDRWIEAMQLMGRCPALLEEGSLPVTTGIALPAAFLSACAWCLWQPNRSEAPRAAEAAVTLLRLATASCGNDVGQLERCGNAAVLMPMLRLQLKHFRWDYALQVAQHWMNAPRREPTDQQQRQGDASQSTSDYEQRVASEFVSRSLNACSLGHGRNTWSFALKILEEAHRRGVRVPDVGLQMAVKASATAPSHAARLIAEAMVLVAENNNALAHKPQQPPSSSPSSPRPRQQHPEKRRRYTDVSQ